MVDQNIIYDEINYSVKTREFMRGTLEYLLPVYNFNISKNIKFYNFFFFIIKVVPKHLTKIVE
jgi:hypothetical protein